MTDSTDTWTKIEFVIAIMTRDYVRAMETGRTILIKEPSNTIIREYLSIIEKIDIDNETNYCADTDNEDTDLVTVGDNDERELNTNNLIQTYSKKSSAFKIDRTSNDNDYSSVENPNKTDGKMYRLLPIKFCRKVD